MWLKNLISFKDFWSPSPHDALELLLGGVEIWPCISRNVEARKFCFHFQLLPSHFHEASLLTSHIKINFHLSRPLALLNLFWYLEMRGFWWNSRCFCNNYDLLCSNLQISLIIFGWFQSMSRTIKYKLIFMNNVRM